jgi:hypothetical protein
MFVFSTFESQRADFLVTVSGRIHPRLLVLSGCDCAETALRAWRVSVTGYTDRPQPSELGGNFFGDGLLGFFVCLILARLMKKQRDEMRTGDCKLEELAKRIAQEKKEASGRRSDAGHTTS